MEKEEFSFEAWVKNMKIVVAIDSFKGSLSTYESGAAVKEAATRVFPDAEVAICPLADGGEGTMQAICSALHGSPAFVRVTGPLGDPIDAEYAVVGDTAIMEMASAAGITLVPADRRDPLHTTTYGVGEMILDAIRNRGCRKFIIGIGGSATNDGGTGMLSALGFSFLRADGTPIQPFGRGLGELAEIRTDNVIPELAECSFRVACDVKNPLTGENGCSAVYGPQKGADARTVAIMDEWLTQYAVLSANVFENADPSYPGAGAAGGMGYALRTYLGAELIGGIDLVIDATHLEEQIQTADLVITGEGRLDGQSCMGKAPIGVAMCAKKHQKPVIAFAGAVTADANLTNAHGIDAFFPILRTPCTLEDAMNIENAYQNLKNTAEQVFRLWCLNGSEN